MRGKRFVTSMVVAAALAGAAGSASGATWRAAATHDRHTTEGGLALYVAGTGPSAAGVVAYAWRITTTRAYANDTSGPVAGGYDTLLVCIGYGSKTWSDGGCTMRPPAPVTTGTAQPETAPIRVRVPSAKLAGQWLEADLTLTGTGLPTLPPAGGSWAPASPLAPAPPTPGRTRTPA